MDAREAVAPGQSRRRRPRGVFGPIALPLAVGLFLVFPEASIPIRILVAAMGLLSLWAGLRFLRALFAEGARRGIGRTSPPAMSPALALPGLLGFATFVATDCLDALFQLGGDDRAPLNILVLALLPMLALGALAGLVATFDRRGSWRLLAFVANGAYLVLAAILVWRLFLTPLA